MRLSRDDELQGESGSIQTQRMMLRQYAAEHGLNVIDEYIDDGWSGTNFDRPDFQRMIDDIEDGKINCVVTKDLSRLGRNYILTGQYTEIYFPSKGVRYIAVNDNVDTINGENELAPFLNILNEMHARQTSKKVKAAMRTRFANGAHYGAYAPLGYVKDPDKKGHLLVDSETRWIIEKIFDLAVHGRGAASITRILVEEKVPTPGWLNFQRYSTFANIYAGAPEEKAYAWTIAQVKSILKEETYIGHSIHNKQTNISFKNKKKVRKPKEEWYRVENTHEAIISEDVFRQVQEQICHNVVLSLDGRKEVHDRFRKDYAGRGSYDAIVPKFQEFVRKRGDKGYYMRGTYTHFNTDFTNDIFHMADLGFTELSMEPVVCKPDDPDTLPGCTLKNRFRYGYRTYCQSEISRKRPAPVLGKRHALPERI